MAQAQTGDTVRVHYSGTLSDGTEFDSSRGREPLQFTLGAGGIIPGFEQAVTGMETGEKKTVTIPAAEAYGARNEAMVQQVPRSQIPEEIELERGVQLRAEGPEGAIIVTVTAFDDDTVTLDANHPLAGEDLTFELELVEIV